LLISFGASVPTLPAPTRFDAVMVAVMVFKWQATLLRSFRIRGERVSGNAMMILTR